LDTFFLQTALEVIDLRSFSDLWFWIALAVFWSMASHRVIGVPFDVVRRAAKGHEQSLHDMHALANIQARRLRLIAEDTGVVSTAIGFFALTMVALLGFAYRVEFAQAILLLLVPLMIVTWMSLRTAMRVDGLDPYDLGNLLAAHRRRVQLVGIVSIFVTSMWGMWVNLNQSVLGV
jgi:hypothetical protein